MLKVLICFYIAGNCCYTDDFDACLLTLVSFLYMIWCNHFYYVAA